MPKEHVKALIKNDGELFMEVLFVFIMSVLLLHEMDAIRTKEWKMFIVLKDMADESAYKVFTFIHLPLYFVAILIMAKGGTHANFVLCCIIDAFLIGHAIIHFYFRNNKNNGFTSSFSKIIIYLMAVLSIVHLCLLFTV